MGGYHTKFLGVNETPHLKQTLKPLTFPLIERVVTDARLTLGAALGFKF